jgi:trk system potassium uptake protein TrkH
MTLRGRRPGDRRVRVERVVPRDYRVTPPRRLRRPPSPWQVLIATFVALIAVGTVLLALPAAAQPGQETDLLDALFTATSAVCVTGLVVVDTATHWSPFGHLVILLLVQVGGFAFMTGSSVLLLALVGGRTSLSDRLRVQAAAGLLDLGNVTSLVRAVAVFTLVCEALGTAVLAAAFVARGIDPLTGVWWGLFHSVSAFNQAGFDLFGGFRSLTGFADAPELLVPLALLVVLGGLGFAIVGDVWAKRRWVRLALETKIVVATTIVLLVVGAVATAAIEWSNPATLGRLAPADRAVNAVFHSATLRSAGLDSVGVTGLTEESLAVGAALMFIGGASGSTAGGIKVNTFAVLLVAIGSAVRGDPSAAAFGRRIPHVVVYRAIAVALLSIAAVFVVALGLQLTGSHAFLDATFEAVSAFGTVGLSTGITPQLDAAGRILVVAAMFVGRLGPLTLVLGLAARARPVAYRPAVETVRIG